MECPWCNWASDLWNVLKTLYCRCSLNESCPLPKRLHFLLLVFFFLNKRREGPCSFLKVKKKWFARYISFNKQSMLTLKCLAILATVTKVVMHPYLGRNQPEGSAYHWKLLSTNQIAVFAIYLNKIAALNFWPIIQKLWPDESHALHQK